MSDDAANDLLALAKVMGVNLRNGAALKAFLDGDVDNAIAASTPGGILAQEAAGARMVVEKMVLPRVLGGFNGADSRETLERLGVKVLGTADDLFYNVELPEGWQQDLTGHSMHTLVLDERGRERIGVFYKAAFYDRKAHLWLRRRFQMHTEPVGGYEGEQYRKHDGTCPQFGYITDGQVRIMETTGIAPSDTLNGYNIDNKVLYPFMKLWLGNIYPNWEDEFSYWDEPDFKPMLDPVQVQQP